MTDVPYRLAHGRVRTRMLIDEVAQLPTKTSDRRVVIIGSGAVGLYAANELAKRSVDIVVIESGGRDLGSFPSDSYRSIGHHHEGISIGRSPIRR